MDDIAPKAGPTADGGYVPFSTFDAFYAFYLGEHQNTTCRRLHFFGSLGALFCLLQLITTLEPRWLAIGLVWGYGLAWIGHFGFAKNKPASFKQPLYSFMGDWVMFKDMLLGRIPF